jgi:Tol biopolymer transport system component
MARLMVVLAAAALAACLPAFDVATAARGGGATLATATSLAPDASPLLASFSPPAGAQILYVADEATTSPLIRLVAADGSLDSLVVPGTLPSWAPDGERIVYTCKPERIDYFGSLCVHDLRSGSDRVVVAEGTLARWSPRGGLIAFSRDVWALGDAWIYRIKPRATWMLPGGQPEWSPTGEWLRYLTSRGIPERPVIHVVHPDGSGARMLGEGWNATWSPDGARIAATWWDGTLSTVTAIDIHSGVRVPLFATDAPILALRWLPDDGFAFVAERGASSTGDLRIVELSTGTEHSLTSDVAVTPDLSVSPDGQWLAFTVEGEEGSDIYFAARQGGWARVTSGAHATRPAWRPTSGSAALVEPVASPAPSPGTSHVADGRLPG